MLEQTTVYSSRATNWPTLLFAAALAVPLFALAVTSPSSPPSILACLGVIALVVLAMASSSSLRVTAGTHGVIVRFGVLGWPRWSYPINRIHSAEQAHLSPWSTIGGIWWSHRDGLRLTLRTGPAIRLRLTNGRRVTINVDNPESAVAALRTASARAQEPPTPE